MRAAELQVTVGTGGFRAEIGTFAVVYNGGMYGERMGSRLGVIQGTAVAFKASTLEMNSEIGGHALCESRITST